MWRRHSTLLRLLGPSGIFAALAGVPPLMTAECAVSLHGPVAPAQYQQLSSSCCQSADASREGCSGQGRASGQFRRQCLIDPLRTGLWVCSEDGIRAVGGTHGESGCMCNPVWSLCGTWYWGDDLGARSPRNQSVLLQESPAGVLLAWLWEGRGRDTHAAGPA